MHYSFYDGLSRSNIIISSADLCIQMHDHLAAPDERLLPLVVETITTTTMVI